RANVESKFSIAKVNNSMQYVTTRDAKFYYSEEEFRSKGINYYPADYPWDLFWPNFHKIPLKDDFELISNAGFNTVRIFVPYHQFGGSNVDDNELKKLTGLLDLAQSNNLKVIVTLFDFFLDYSVDRWTLSERHLEKVVSSFKDHPAIMAWDIKNEPDLDFEQHGKNEVKEWLKFITLCIRKYDSNHLVTIGWSNPKYLDDISDYVDYYSFHYYNDPKELNNYLEMDFDKPIVLEETGQHSYNAWWYPFHKSAQDQEDYTSEILEVIDHYDLSYSFWTLYDFQNIPDNVVGTVYWRKGIQKNFGFIDRYNKPKPSFEVVKNYNLLEL
ncbi:MAG: cellulase family glycosylhydrolase, partial [Bacteroidota bacterium]